MFMKRKKETSHSGMHKCMQCEDFKFVALHACDDFKIITCMQTLQRGFAARPPVAFHWSNSRKFLYNMFVSSGTGSRLISHRFSLMFMNCSRHSASIPIARIAWNTLCSINLHLRSYNLTVRRRYLRCWRVGWCSNEWTPPQLVCIALMYSYSLSLATPHPGRRACST